MGSAAEALPPAFPLGDIVAQYTEDPRMTRTKWVLWACDCAERVLPVFETKYPDDVRPRRALEAARAWLAEPTEANRENADAAAYAAYATACAAYAAYATACAAYAAAYATACAAYAADAAAYATACAADAARATEQTWQAVRLMEIYNG